MRKNNMVDLTQYRIKYVNKSNCSDYYIHTHTLQYLSNIKIFGFSFKHWIDVPNIICPIVTKRGYYYTSISLLNTFEINNLLECLNKHDGYCYICNISHSFQGDNRDNFGDVGCALNSRAEKILRYQNISISEYLNSNENIPSSDINDEDNPQSWNIYAMQAFCAKNTNINEYLSTYNTVLEASRKNDLYWKKYKKNCEIKKQQEQQYLKNTIKIKG